MEQLVKRAQRGDADAFEQLIASCTHSLYATAKAVLHSDADAADAIQDAVLRAWQKLPSLTKPAFFKTWLTRILLYRCYDILRQSSRTVPVETPPDRPVFIASDEALDVNAALEMLAKNDKLILTLFYLDDLSVKQIAQLLPLSESAVRTRLSRARTHFKTVWLAKEEAK